MAKYNGNNNDNKKDPKPVEYHITTDITENKDHKPSPHIICDGNGNTETLTKNKTNVDKNKAKRKNDSSPLPSPFLRPGETPATTSSVACMPDSPAASAYSPNFVSSYF